MMILYIVKLFYIISKMLRESAWKKQQSILEEDANSLSILKKQISKESEIDASVQLSINDKIEMLKQNAAVLAKKLENEKHKNFELQTIISHMRNILDKDKQEEATLRETNSFESLAGLENRFKKLEYDLGQLNGKTNRIAENVEDKRIKINQNRTERVIDSGIFRNIEKELIESELKFKKLLIEKIKYQKEYEKLLKNYEGLKEHAESHSQQKEGNKKSVNSSLNIENQSKQSIYMKFVNLEISKDGNQKPRSMAHIDGEHEFQEQQNIIVIKKLLSDTGLEHCQQLLSHFFHIEEINDKYFNEMTIYADQSNEIEKYLNDFKHQKGDNKLRFYEKKHKPTKSQALRTDAKKIKSLIDSTNQEANVQSAEILSFFNEPNLSDFFKCFGLPKYTLKEGSLQFDELKEVLQELEKQMHEILAKGNLTYSEKISSTSRSKQNQKLEDLMSKVKKLDENLKIMKKQEFQQQYHKMLKSSTSKNLLIKNQQKRQSCAKLKK